MTKKWMISLLCLAMVLIAAPLWAQDEAELAKKTQNPVADLISVPFQNNINFGFGPDDNVQNVLNVQPVVPFSLSENWNLITRTILPGSINPRAFLVAMNLDWVTRLSRSFYLLLNRVSSSGASDRSFISPQTPVTSLEPTNGVRARQQWGYS